jgi:ABC-2 type transport system ATP-binding protein
LTHPVDAVKRPAPAEGGAAPQEPAASPVPRKGPSAGDAVHTVDLTRAFGTLVAVDRVSVDVRAGEIFGLIGPNGAGKTTMIKMLATLLRPSGGRGWVAGFDIVAQPQRVRRRIGYLPQMISTDGTLTAYENLLLSAQLYNIPRRERAQRIRDALVRAKLEDAAGRQVGHYSGGMVRSLEIAQATLHRPAVLFADEPTVGLDPVAYMAVWAHLRDLRERGMTILVTTHNMEEADEHCDRVAVMHAGRVAVIGSPADLKTQVGPGASLGDVFVHFTGADIERGGEFRDILRSRRTIRRLS